MKPMNKNGVTDRLVRLSAYAMNLGQFGLLLYFLTPITLHLRWLFIVLTLGFLLSIGLSMASLYALFKRNRFMAMTTFMGSEKDRLFEIMIGIAGLIIGLVCANYGVCLVAGLTLFNGISGFFFPKSPHRH